MTLRVGVIGAGNIGTDHVRTLERHVCGARVVAVADVALDRAQQALPPDRAGGSDGGTGTVRWATDDPWALIGDPRVDAVLVASGDDTHAPFVEAAVRAGKPVLCEKPLAPGLDEALRLRAALGADAGLVSLGFMRRFDPGYRGLRSAVEARTVGRPLLLHCVSRGVSSASGIDTATSINNSLAHELDVVPWLLGSPIVQVSWQAPACTRAPGTAGGRLQDPQLVLLRTADGVLSSCETFLNARYGYDIRCEVVGETGSISLAGPARVVTDGPAGRSSAHAADWRERFADAYRLELQAWVDGVTGRLADGADRPATLADGVRTAAVAAAVVQSMRGGGIFVDVVEPAREPAW